MQKLKNIGSFDMIRRKLIKSEAVRRLQQFDTHQNLPCSVTVQIPTENIRFSSSKSVEIG